MRNTYKALFIILIMGLLALSPAVSYADWHDGHGGGHGYSGGYGGGGWRGHSYVGINFSTVPADYYYGAPYYPYSPDDDVLVSPAPVDQPPPVTVVEPPPTTVDQSQTVVVNQAAEPAAPVITPAAGSATPDTADAITINIPNNKGGYTAVTLKRSGNGFIGPQGEFYPEFPAVAKLEIIYGK